MHCPECKTKLQAQKQKPIMTEITKFSGLVEVTPIKWFCPKCKKIIPHGLEEIIAVGMLNNG